LPASLVSEGKANQERWAYPFEIPVNDPEVVKVGHTGRGLGELKVLDEQEE